MFPVLCIVYTVYVCVLVSGVTERSLFSSTRTLHSHTHTHTHTHGHTHTHTNTHTNTHIHTHTHKAPLLCHTSGSVHFCYTVLIFKSLPCIYLSFLSPSFYLLNGFPQAPTIVKNKHIGIDYKIILGHH